MEASDTTFVPLRGMESCAIFENQEFFRELQRSVLRDMLERGRMKLTDFQQSMQQLESKSG